jgi:hypothetical protein
MRSIFLPRRHTIGSASPDFCGIFEAGPFPAVQPSPMGATISQTTLRFSSGNRLTLEGSNSGRFAQIACLRENLRFGSLLRSGNVALRGWGDSYNTTTEFTIVNQARSLASLALWATRTPAAQQAWKTANAEIVVARPYISLGAPVTVSLQCDSLDLSKARIVWEANAQEPYIGNALSWTFIPTGLGEQWVEAEATFPDGRRVAAAATFSTTLSTGTCICTRLQHNWPLPL